MPAQRGSGLLASGHDVEHTVGQAGLGQEFRQPQRGQRRVRGRLVHHRVAGGEGGGDLRGGQDQGEVVRRDRRDDTQWFPACVGQARTADAARRALDLVGQATVVGEVVDGIPEVGGTGDRDRLAGVQALQSGQLIAALGQQCGDLEHYGAALPPPLIRGQSPSSKAFRAAVTAASTSSPAASATVVTT